MIKKFLEWKRHGKQRCTRCHAWKDPDLVESGWCKVCVWRQTAFVLELIGSVLAARCIGHDDHSVKDIIESAKYELRSLPKSKENVGLYQALWIAENHSVEVSTISQLA